MNLHLDNIKKAHLIGIGGISMSAIAEILMKNKIAVTGSDITETKLTRHLTELGAEVHIGHNEKNISNVDLVVYTSAVNEENPELAYAIKNNIPILKRSEVLGLLMTDFETSVAISGTHGKTTTTSMVSIILNDAKLDPVLLVGANVKEIGGNAKIGDGDIIVSEACEYKGNFLDFNYNVGVILNIEEDHLDYFKDLSEINDIFRKFSKKIPETGILILNNDDYNVKSMRNHVECGTYTFGLQDEADFRGHGITYDENGYPSFEVTYMGEHLMKVSLSVPGKHNIYNSLAAIAVAYLKGVELDIIAASLGKFKGADRRFEFKGTLNGGKLYEDYAHHPTEIKVTLEAMSKMPFKKSIVAFQPHTFSRAKELRDEFAHSFEGVDEVLVLDIYAAREKNTYGIYATDLVESINEVSGNASYSESFEAVAEILKKKMDEDTIFIAVGAGDIYKIFEHLEK